ncbi:MAG: zinc-dependent alcohol dehydrogenase [Candidatus Helarchaeota archaeon]
MAKMLAGVFHRKGESGGEVVLEEVEIPTIKELTDVLIEVKTAGICGTDLRILEGRHPANDKTILGHEFCGIVKEVGEHVTDLTIGEKVVVDPNLKCGVCTPCRCGHESQCEFLATGQTLGVYRHGGFAKYCVVPRNAIYPLPPDIDLTYAALTEPLSCAVHCHNLADVQECDNVVILGGGSMGLIIESIIRKHPLNQLIVVEPMEYRREKAVELGADHVINPATEDVEKAIDHLTNHNGAEVVIDAVGISATFQIALKIWAKGGRLILFGQDTSASAIVKPNEIVRWERKIYGSFISTGIDYLTAINLIKTRNIAVDKLLTHQIPLDKLISDGFRIMQEKKCIKIAIIQ